MTPVLNLRVLAFKFVESTIRFHSSEMFIAMHLFLKQTSAAIFIATAQQRLVPIVLKLGRSLVLIIHSLFVISVSRNVNILRSRTDSVPSLWLVTNEDKPAYDIRTLSNDY